MCEDMDLTIINYESIRQWVRYQRGRRVPDALAMSEKRDPFYADQPGRLEGAQWFAGIWNEFGIGHGTHLRRIHYRLASVSPAIRLWNGKEYENTRECWELLLLAAANARYLDLVPAGDVEDHRNDPPMIFIPDDEPEPEVTLAEGLRWRVELFDWLDPPDFAITYPQGRQRYHLEVLCEKTSMNDILQPLCERYQAVLVTASGEVSIAQTDALAQRIIADERPARLYHITDFDPSGQTMPVSACRKIEYRLRKLLGGPLGLWDVQYRHLALTHEQVEQFNLPRKPGKESDLRRPGFERQHGTGAVELDALEAMQPGLLAEIVEDALTPFFDETLAERVAQQRRALEAAGRAAASAALEPFVDRRESLEERVNALLASVEDEIAELDAEARALGEEITEALAEVVPDVADFPVPEPEEADEDDLPEPLFDGYRDYFDQIACYKRFQGKDGSLDD
jgi:hypothetical protein